MPTRIIDPRVPPNVIGEPKTTAVVVDTPEGKIAFPQVAVAMISPEVLECIVQGVFARFNPQPDAIDAKYSDTEALEAFEAEGGAVQAG